MKKILMYFLVLAFCLTPYITFASTDRVFDYAEVFSTAEINEIQQAIDAFRNETGMDYAVITIDVNIGNRTHHEVVRGYYRSLGIGTGDDASGVMYSLNFNTNNRYEYLYTDGIMIDYMTDSRIESALDQSNPKLRMGLYAEGALSMIDQVLACVRSGIPYGQYRYDVETGEQLTPTYYPPGTSDYTAGYVFHPNMSADNYWLRLYPTEDHLSFNEKTTAQRYAAIIDQFNVTYGENDSTVDGWYEQVPGSTYRKETYCNYFAVDVAYAMGVYLPLVKNCAICGKPTAQSFGSIGVSSTDHYLYQALLNAGLICTDSSHAAAYQDYNANSLYQWLANSSFSGMFGWVSISESEAQEKANEGYMTIGIISGSPGHVFVIHPHANSSSQIYISQAGSDLMNDEPKPTFYTNYHYYYNAGIASQNDSTSIGIPSNHPILGIWTAKIFGISTSMEFRSNGVLIFSTLGFSIPYQYSITDDTISIAMNSDYLEMGTLPSGISTYTISGDQLLIDSVIYTRFK